jgi:hypothetical protein
MRSTRLASFGAAILLATAVPAADSLPDFSGDRFLIGRWSCDAAREGRPPARENAAYSWGLGGRWLQLRYTLHPTENGVRPTTTDAWETFDPALKKWVYVSVSSDGSHGISYSDGWKNGVKVYGPGGAESQPFRLTATRVSDREFTEVAQIPSKGNDWRTVFSLRCRRDD